MNAPILVKFWGKTCRLAFLLAGTVLLSQAVDIQAATVLQTTNATSSHPNWNNSTVWGGTVTTGNTYVTNPSASGSFAAAEIGFGSGVTVTSRVRESGTTFAGDMLVIAGGTELLLKNQGGTSSGNITLQNNGVIRHGPNAGTTTNNNLNGTLTLENGATGYLGIVQSVSTTLNVNSTITGASGTTLRLISGNQFGQSSPAPSHTLRLGGNLTGFNGTLDIGNSSSTNADLPLVGLTLDYSGGGNFDMSNASLIMGNHLTNDVLSIDEIWSVKAFTFGATSLSAGFYSVNTLNSMFGTGSQFTSIDGNINGITVVPEPSTYALLLCGLGGLLWLRRRKA